MEKGNVLNYKGVKSWVGQGTYGFVFGTYDKNESIAVKIARFPKRCQDQSMEEFFNLSLIHISEPTRPY